MGRCKAVDIWRFRVGGRSLAGHYRDGQFISRLEVRGRGDFNHSSLRVHNVDHKILIFSNMRDFNGLSS